MIRLPHESSTCVLDPRHRSCGSSDQQDDGGFHCTFFSGRIDGSQVKVAGWVHQAWCTQSILAVPTSQAGQLTRLSVTSQIVKSHLWSICPSEPCTAEEEVLERQLEAVEATIEVSCCCQA